MLEKVGMGGVSSSKEEKTLQNPQTSPQNNSDRFVLEESLPDQQIPVNTRNRTAELAASSGGAIALAILCNKALFPIRVPITLALTPPIARFLARRRIIKNGV